MDTGALAFAGLSALAWLYHKNPVQLADLTKSMGQGVTNAVGQVFGRTLSEAQVRNLAQSTVQTYFPRVDPNMLVAMAWIESSFRADAIRYEPHIDDGSTGLMQTLVGTADWLWREMGARAFGEPSPQSLLDPAQSMYFGAAYVNWLRTYGGKARSEEWIVRAYNGGPGWEARAGAVTQTANHWAKYQAARGRFG
eukprot:NODE_1099_length_1180_cov_0.029602.p1 type:complete len:195 gc:universal NODE_1099_length_1180_cov_0.029602:984-400(-)